MMRKLLTLLLLAPLLAYGATVTRTVTLKNRSADEVANLLRPVAPTGLAIFANGGQVILRGDEGQVSDLVKLAGKLDVAQKQLRITVRQGGNAERGAEGGEVSGTVAKPQVRVYGTHDRDQPAMTQQVQVIEGQWARIEMGTSVPVVQQSTVVGPNGTTVQQQTEYKDVSSGFEVLPRLTGETVTLEVRAYRGGLARQGGGVIENAQTQSTVQGRVGQWFELAGSLDETRRDERGTVYSTRSREQRQGRVQIKVELIP